MSNSTMPYNYRRSSRPAPGWLRRIVPSRFVDTVELPRPLGCGAPDGLLDPEFNYEYVIALSDEFRFVHEPTAFLGADVLTDHRWSTDCFVGREREVRLLTQRILLSHGGAFLVTGYRGVGKTSFVNRVVQQVKLACESEWGRRRFGSLEVVDVHLNLAREVTPGELMHHVIRSMYSSLADRGVLPLLDRTTREALVLAFRRTSINLTQRYMSAHERSIGISQIGIPLKGLAAQVGLTDSHSKGEELDMAYLPFDDKAAEYDLIQLASKISQGYTGRSSLARRILNAISGVEPPRTAA